MNTAIKIYLLGINFLIFGYLLELLNLEYLGLSILALGFLYHLAFHNSTSFLSTGIQSSMKSIKLLPKILSISLEFAKINKRYIFVTAISISLGVAALSQAYITVNLQNDKFYSEATSNVAYPGLRFKVEGNSYLPTLNGALTKKFVTSYIQTINNIESKARENIDPSQTLTNIRWISYLDNLEYNDPKIQIVTKNINLITTTIDLFDIISKNWGQLQGRLPSNFNETIVIKAPGGLPDIQPSFQLNQNVTIEYKQNSGNIFQSYNANFTIVGIIILNQLEISTEISWADLSLSPLIFYVNQDGFINAFNHYNHLPPLSHVQVYYYDFNKQYIPHIVTFLNQLTHESIIISSSTIFNGLNIKSITSPLEEKISWASSILNQMRLVFLYLAIPIIAIAVLLANLSFNLQRKKLGRFISGMKIRGLSNEQLIITNLLLIFHSSIIGFTFGLLLSFPLSFLMAKSSGFLQFNNTVSLPYLSFSQIITVFVLSFIIALDTSLLDLLNMSNVPLTNQQVDKPLTPVWRRYHIDLVLTIVGSYLAYFTLNVANNSIVHLSGSILTILGLLSLITTLIGVILLTSWYIGKFIVKFGTFLSLFFDSVFILSFKNITLKRNLTSKLSVILIISASFLIFLIITPISIHQYANESAYYNVGSDLVIEDVEFQNPMYNLIMPTISGIQSYTEMFIMTFQAEFNGQTDYFTLAGINTTTFKSAAYFKNSYLIEGESLDLMIKDLQYQSASYIWYDMAIERKLRLGGSMEFNVIPQKLSTISNETIHARLNIDGVFKFMPRIITEGMDRHQFYFITSLKTAISFQHEITMKNIISTKAFTFIRALPNEDLPSLKEKIFSSIVAQFRFSGIHYVGEEFISSPQAAFLINTDSYIFFGFFFAVIFSVLALTFYSQLNLVERKFEVGVYKSIGMISRQLLSIFMSEILFFLLFSLPIGLILGVFMAVVSIRLMRAPEFGGAIPPIYPTYPWDLISYAYLLLFLISIISVILPALKYARTKSGEIMAVDE